jgi:8-oxo-dGTP pyrophosphatase MutT (NUDIX family)
MNRSDTSFATNRTSLHEAGTADGDIWRPHVTVATVVPREGRFLLVEENVRGRLVINQPAGHLDPDESLQAAAVRETLEETGWDIELDCLLCVQQWRSAESGRQFVRFTFGAAPLRHDPSRTLDEGIVRALWLTREEIAAESARLRSPMVIASIDDWSAGHGLPLDASRYLCARP